MRGLVISMLLALAACSAPASFPETEGVSQKDKMDLATKLYAECLTEATADAAVNNDAAGSIANRVMMVCKDKRNTLMADVIAFHQIGHPKFSIAQSKAVAEASIATIEDELRRQAVVSIVSRQLASGNAGTGMAATTPAPGTAAITPPVPGSTLPGNSGGAPADQGIY